MKATIIIPTFDHGELIKFPIESILRQTHQDFELFVIGDGAPKKTDEIMADYQQKDQRIRYFKFPKGPRLGEAYRNPVLNEATGDFVCYLADDDLYLENHLEVLAVALEDADFAHSLPVKILPGGLPYIWQVDLKLPWYQNLLLSGTNRIPLGMAGHRMDFYKRLPYGWRETPIGVPTDLYMWQQIIAEPQVRLKSLFEVTALHFASPDRKEMSHAERCVELENYFKLILDPQKLKKLKEEIFLKRLTTGFDFEIEAVTRGQEIQTRLEKRVFQLIEHEKALELEKEDLKAELRHEQNMIQDLQQEIVRQEHQIIEFQAQLRSRAYRLVVFCRELLKKLGILKFFQ